MITGTPGRSAACLPVLHSLSGPKMGFSPRTGATHYSDKRDIWHGRFPVPNFTFIGAQRWEYSPQNCQNFAPSGATGLHNFLQNYQRLYASRGSFQSFN